MSTSLPNEIDDKHLVNEAENSEEEEILREDLSEDQGEDLREAAITPPEDDEAVFSNKVRYFPGPMIFRKPIDVETAVAEILKGGVVHGAKHPLFFAWPLFFAQIFYATAVLLLLLGDRVWIYPLSFFAAFLLVTYIISFINVKLHFLAVNRDTVIIQKGIIRSRPIILSISELAEVNLEEPLRGLGWLQYASWQPVLPGEQADKPVKHIMYMSQLQEIINRLKHQEKSRDAAHDMEDLDEQKQQNQLLARLVELSEQTVARLDDIVRLLKDERLAEHQPENPHPETAVLDTDKILAKPQLET